LAPLAAVALDQEPVADAPAVLVIAAVLQRTSVKYGERGRRYVHMEVGHAAQNVYLQAGSLGLGTVMVGAFDDAAVRRVLGLPHEEEVLALMPVGPVD
jgi:SagB-type dehydrogenase family enzyme